MTPQIKLALVGLGALAVVSIVGTGGVIVWKLIASGKADAVLAAAGQAHKQVTDTEFKRRDDQGEANKREVLRVKKHFTEIHKSRAGFRELLEADWDAMLQADPHGFRANADARTEQLRVDTQRDLWGERQQAGDM